MTPALKNSFALMAAILFVCCTHTSCDARSLTDGTFVGMEPMTNLSADEPGTAWFHQNTLVIKGGHATLDKIPVWTKAGKLVYSASDGGFYTYQGTVESIAGHCILHLKLTASDYVPVATRDRNASKELEVALNADGSLLIEGIRYRRKK